jgi:hypothetical protein
MDQDNKSQISDKVIKAIEDGQVSMRPKWKFSVETALLFVGVLTVALILLYVTSFIVFSLRENGLWFTPGFGAPGFGVFFSSLPWILIAVTVVFVFLLEFLVKRYAFSYSQPFLYSAVAILGIVVVGGVVLGETTLHERIEQNSRGLPFAPNFYQHFRQTPENLTVGQIIELKDDGCKLKGPERMLFNVKITSQTQLPPQALALGDFVVVLGPRKGDRVEAVAISQAPLPPPRYKEELR